VDNETGVAGASLGRSAPATPWDRERRNPKEHQSRRTKLIMTQAIRYVDEFYYDPDLVRELALRSEYHTPKRLYGLRSVDGFLPRGALEKFDSVFGLTAIEMELPSDRNTCFFQSFGKGANKERFFAHVDYWPENEQPGVQHYSCVVYLTPNAPPDSGTGFYRHKETGISQAPTAEDARRLGKSLRKLVQQARADSGVEDRWEMYQSVENVYNRAVLFPAHWYHAGMRYFGNSLKNGRIYQAFFFSARCR
jgi:hypothetical protein